LGLVIASKQQGRFRSPLSVALSKHHKTSSADNSLSKGSRPKSIDLGPNFTLPNRLRRPNSRDRPPVVGAFDDIIHRPTSSYKLETIDEPDATPIFERRPLRRKRRSSLSDLRSLMENASLEDVPTLPLRLNRQRTPEKAARTPSPTKVTISPQAQVQIIRSSSSRQKENGDSQQETTDSSDTEQGSLSRTRAKTITISQIPTLKPVTRYLSRPRPSHLLGLPAVPANFLAVARESGCRPPKSCANGFRPKRKSSRKWIPPSSLSYRASQRTCRE
jgi:hypothetical protein